MEMQIVRSEWAKCREAKLAREWLFHKDKNLNMYVVFEAKL